jgi:hypothetical protein
MNRRHQRRAKRLHVVNMADARVIVAGTDIGSAVEVFGPCDEVDKVIDDINATPGTPWVAKRYIDAHPPDDGRCREDRPAR